MEADLYRSRIFLSGLHCSDTQLTLMNLNKQCIYKAILLLYLFSVLTAITTNSFHWKNTKSELEYFLLLKTRIDVYELCATALELRGDQINVIILVRIWMATSYTSKKQRVEIKSMDSLLNEIPSVSTMSTDDAQKSGKRLAKTLEEFFDNPTNLILRKEQLDSYVEVIIYQWFFLTRLTSEIFVFDL